MKLLFDANISYRIVKKLQAVFTKPTHVSSVGLLKASDLEIWTYAKNNGYTIVSNDSDFNDLSTLNGFPPKIIWLRLGNTSTGNVATILIHNEKRIKSFIESHESGILEILN